MKSNIHVLRHPKFTNNQICAGFSTSIYVETCQHFKDTSCAVPEEIPKSTVFHFQVLCQQCGHPRCFTFLQWKGRTGYPQGAGQAALKTPAFHNHSHTNLCHNHSPGRASWQFQLCVHTMFWTLCNWHQVLLALWLCGLLASKDVSGATNLIDTACQSATRYFWSLLPDTRFELLKGFTSHILLHIIWATLSL